MRMPDVNLLVYAHREESVDHERYAEWLTALANSEERLALSEQVMQGFVRVVTLPKAFPTASTPGQAFDFLDELLSRPNVLALRPGERHFTIFRSLCTEYRIRGKLVADAAHAALAIEHGCTWCSADTDFKRFEPLLRWEHV